MLYQQPRVLNLPELLNLVQSGRLRLACFPRGIVWSDEQRIALFDSIYEGLPLGSLLTWYTRRGCTQHTDVSYTELDASRFNWTTKEDLSKEDLSIEYLLDGNQRLLTLFFALTQPLSPSTAVYYDLATECFVTGYNENPGARSFPLVDTLQSKRIFNFQRNLYQVCPQHAEKDSKRVDNLVATLKRYEISIVTLVTEELHLARKLFQRVHNRDMG
jgi:hypothetical protein